jgi:hypothetical protein
VSKSCATCARTLSPVRSVERAAMAAFGATWCAPLTERGAVFFAGSRRENPQVLVPINNFGGLSCATLRDGKRGDLYAPLSLEVLNGLKIAVNRPSSGVMVNKPRRAAVQGALC